VALPLSEIDLSATDYRDLGRAPKPKLSFLEALSFSIASTWATRPAVQKDPDKADRQTQAVAYGLVWYFTHRGV
jgi:hypothetical protein